MRLIKAILFGITFTLICDVASAQGILQISAVKYIQFPCGVVGICDSVITIPTGKVWKIESVTISGGDGSEFKLNGTRIFVQSANTQYTSFPIWLPAGTYTFSTRFISFNQGAFLSAIEFNLTP